VHIGGGDATRPLPRDEGVEELHETQQSGHAQRAYLGGFKSQIGQICRNVANFQMLSTWVSQINSQGMGETLKIYLFIINECVVSVIHLII